MLQLVVYVIVDAGGMPWNTLGKSLTQLDSMRSLPLSRRSRKSTAFSVVLVADRFAVGRRRTFRAGAGR